MEPRSPAQQDGGPAEAKSSTPASDIRRTLTILLAVGIALLVLGGLLVLITWLIRSPQTAEAVRDAVIVAIGIESVITGVAVLVLVVQVARLTAMLQNEIRPMLEATNDALRTVRGTTEFLSDNMVRPVVRLSGAAAAIRRAFDLIGLGRLR